MNVPVRKWKWKTQTKRCGELKYNYSSCMGVSWDGYFEEEVSGKKKKKEDN